MLFNSIDFALFLPLVFAIYWMIGSERIRIQNTWILIASYFFYGWWDYRFLGLIIFSSLADFLIGLGLSKTENKKERKYLLTTSVFLNIGLLAFFKYFNFFVDNFIEAFSLFGNEQSYSTLSIILPVGISFYTFQTLSYTIDIYRKKIEPTRDVLVFFSYVSFFPQLVAGPIERARNLLPQFKKKRTFNYDLARDGTRQIIWGLFKKIVIADTCAIHANYIFEHHQELNSSTLILGMIYFTFQIYCDFSGYSDMAIGLGKLFGFKLMKNFDYPFFSRNFNEFWSKWHISLTSWFFEYLYIPLGGGRKGTWIKIRNIIIIFTLSGFWHGANWTFLIWGFLYGLLYIPVVLYPADKTLSPVIAQGKLFPSFKELRGMLLVTGVFITSSILFRSVNIQAAWEFTKGVLAFDIFPLRLKFTNYLGFIALLLIWEWLCRTKDHGLQIDGLPQFIRWIIYLIVTWLILYYFGLEKEFIYFQF